MIIEALIFIALITIWWFVEDKKRYKGCPPGPLRFPLIGNLLQLGTKPPAISLAELSKKYGDVVFVKVGTLPAVAFTSYESIVEIFHHEKMGTSRGGNLIPFVKDREFGGKNLGIIWGNDDPWQTLRRFTIRTLRDFGFGKTMNMDFAINEELEKLVAVINEKLEASKNNVLRVDDLFDLSVVNALWRLVTGVNYSLDDPKIKRLMEMSNEMVQSSTFAFDLSVAYPLLHPFFGKQMQLKFRDQLYEFALETIKEHRTSGKYKYDPQCYVDEFLVKIEENPGSDTFNDEQLGVTLLDLFQAGAETSSKTLAFGLMYMILNPDVQKKVQDEIDSVVPPGSQITSSYRNQLPYCFATILEMQRYASVVPFPPLRLANEDIPFRNFIIKEGSALMLNLQAVHYNDSIWGDPKVFRPERFLTKDGSAIDSKMADYVLSFGGGKRKCLGIQLAETTLFLYFTTLLRHFKVSNAPGQKEPSVVPMVGMTHSPQPFSAQFIRRA